MLRWRRMPFNQRCSLRAERAAEGQQQQGDQAADGAGHKGQAVEGSPGPSRRSAAKRRATAQGGRRGGAKRQLHVVEAFRPPDMPQVLLLPRR